MTFLFVISVAMSAFDCQRAKLTIKKLNTGNEDRTVEIECYILGSVNQGTLSGGSIFCKSLQDEGANPLSSTFLLSTTPSIPAGAG